MSSLSEYLYIDENRLDAYIEQIRSPITFDKVPQWSVELSITGPKAGSSQARQSRSLTTYEKIKTLVEYLRGNSELEEGRAEWRSHSDFFLETCEAIRVIIPFSELLPRKDSSDIALWISSGNWASSQSKSRFATTGINLRRNKTAI